MPKTNMTTIDPAKLRKFVRKKGVKKVTEMLGKGDYYFYDIYKSGKMPVKVLNAMCAIFDVTPADFKPDPPKPKPTVAIVRPTLPMTNTLVNRPDLCSSRSMPSVGYAIDLQVYDDFVQMTLVEDSKVVKTAKARIKKEDKTATQFEIVQAISYAAHLIYKFVEQDEIG